MGPTLLVRPGKLPRAAQCSEGSTALSSPSITEPSPKSSAMRIGESPDHCFRESDLVLRGATGGARFHDWYTLWV
nr:MAG: hypothetical protein [Sesarmops intermedium nimavirus]